MVATPTVLLEQRLRSTSVTIVLGVAIAVFVATALIVADIGSGQGIPPLAAAVLSVGIVVVFFCFLVSIRVVVRVVEDASGRRLEILYGPGGLVHQKFARGEIESATAENLTLMQMGGLGYRGSLRLFHRAALVTRRGEALSLNLRGNRHFFVTVDTPLNFVEALGR